MSQPRSGSAWEPQPEQPAQQVPVEGTVVSAGEYPVGFAGAPGTAAQAHSPEFSPTVAQGYWNQQPAGYGPAAPAARRRRWLPFALAGAGLALLLGGGAGGYAIGHHAGAATTSQTGQVGSGTDGQFPGFGSGGQSGGQLGGPMGGDQFGSQLGQQGGTTDGGTTDGGTSGGTTT